MLCEWNLDVTFFYLGVQFVRAHLSSAATISIVMLTPRCAFQITTFELRPEDGKGIKANLKRLMRTKDTVVSTVPHRV